MCLSVLRSSKFHAWPYKFKNKVKSNGYICGLEFNQYVCISFRDNRTILGRDMPSSMFDLPNLKVKAMAKVKIKCSYFTAGVHLICVLFVSWKSDNFWPRYAKFYVWPWKFKVKVMAKVKLNSPILGPTSYRWACFSFRENRTIFGRDMASSMFDLQNSRSRSWPRSNQMLQFLGWSPIDMFAFRFVTIGPFLAKICQVLCLTEKIRHFSIPAWPWKLTNDLENQWGTWTQSSTAVSTISQASAN